MKHTAIEHIKQKLLQEYQNDDGFTYTQNFADSEFIEYEIKEFLKHYKEYMAKETIEALFSLTWYSLDRLVYEILNNSDKQSLIQELSRAQNYAYFSLYFSANTCECFSGSLSINMHKIVLPFSINILCGTWEKTLDIGTYFIDSLNAKNCIIGRGDSTATRSWFLIEIFSKVSNIEIDTKKVIYPKKEIYYPYYDVLGIWDTEDVKVLDKHIYILCEHHLSLAFSEITDDNEDARNLDFEIFPFQLLPYEILAWLKLREKAGLKNPKTFTHPLMNTPIAKMFLNIKEPLPHPKELPFAKELLEKLQEQCPDVEIPEWLEEISNRHTIPEDFMH